MTNIPLYLSIGIPTLLVLVGLLLNYSATRDVAVRLGQIERDLRVFYRDIGNHDGRLEALERR